MNDSRKTKGQLLYEVEELRRQVAALQARAAEHERIEEARRESEERYRTLVEHTYDFVIEASVDGHFLYVSSDYTDILGYAPAELLGSNIFDLMHPDDTPSAAAAFAKGVEMHTSEQAVFRYRHKNGEWRWFESTGRSFRTATGEVRAMIVSRDVTERKRVEEQIRALNAELEQRVMARTAELQAANELKDELLLREQAASAELAQAREREMEIGYKIQQTLLLDQPPRDIAGLRVAALTIPSQRIDGDFYVFFKHPDQCLDIIVGDVMGKGVPAALLGAATKSHFIEALSHLMALSKEGKIPKPQEIVTLVHAEVAQHLINLENFVTLCYARLDLKTRSLDLVDCGHTGMIHVHGETGLCEMVHGDNLPLGIREGEIYDQISVPLAPGDVLLFYSDGVTETRNLAGELFGADRLLQCVTLNRKLEPEALVETIRKATITFSASDRLSDDLTCVAIKVAEGQAPLARTEIEIRSDLKELSRIREFVRTFCRQLPGSPLHEDSVAEFELAVNEAACNIMKHAYHGRADQWISLEAEAFPGKVSILLHHLGDPFDPSVVPPPPLDGSHESGFGIHLITKSVDEVRYSRDERGRNCITLIKICSSEREGRGRRDGDSDRQSR